MSKLNQSIKTDFASNKVDMCVLKAFTAPCHPLSLSLQGQFATGQLNGYPLWKNAVVLTPKTGWAAIGTHSFELAQFDNFAVVAE